MSANHHQVTVSASKKPAGKSKGGKKMLRHMTVTPMANGGATVEHHFMPSDGSDMFSGSGTTPASETHGFNKNKQVGQHVASMLEGMPGGAANADMAGEPGAENA